MKKYMVRCDIEGVTGVVSYEQAEPGKAEFAFGQRMFMADLLSLLEGLNQGGADEIVIYDEHFDGRNIDIDRLPANATAICGKPPYRPDWAGGLDETFAGLILLGFHSKRGTGHLLHHSYEPDIADLLLNGVSVGEIGIEAAIAGDFGVPLVMVTADSAGVTEAGTLVPGVIGVVVKESVSAEGGACHAAARTSQMIRDAARQVVETPLVTGVYRVEHPQLEILLNPGPYRDRFEELFNCSASITLTGETVTECWAQYWQMKLQAQEEVA